MLQITKAKSLRIGICLVAPLILDICMHMVWAPTPKYQVPVSQIAKAGWFLPAVMTLLLGMYLVLALVFQSIQSRLPGTKLRKGLGFGLAFGGLMFISSPAMSFLYGSPLNAELRIGFVDGCAICFLGVLLGLLIATDGSPRRKLSLLSAIVSIACMGLGFFALHFLINLALPSLFPTPFAERTQLQLWILAQGIWLGLMNWIFKDAFAFGSFIRQSFGFACLAFGIFSVVNTLFVPFFVSAPIALLLINTCVGILVVGASALAERVGTSFLQRSR
jgi:hypothetical protein